MGMIKRMLQRMTAVQVRVEVIVVRADAVVVIVIVVAAQLIRMQRIVLRERLRMMMQMVSVVCKNKQSVRQVLIIAIGLVRVKYAQINWHIEICARISDYHSKYIFRTYRKHSCTGEINHVCVCGCVCVCARARK